MDTSGGVRNEDLIWSRPPLSLPLRSSPRSWEKDQDAALEEEIQSLLLKRAIQRSTPSSPGCQEGRELETYCQPESSQSLCDHPAFQVGDHPEFGPAPAPLIITKLLKPVMTYLRQIRRYVGVRIMIYLVIMVPSTEDTSWSFHTQSSIS